MARDRLQALDPMKLLAVSDLHFGLAQYDWVVQQAERFDGVIIAGDLLDIAGHLDLDAQITVVARYLRTLASRTRLFVCSGNHDGDETDSSDEYVARTGGAWASRLESTWIFNAGRTHGAPPAVIELDLTNETATWISQAGVETVDLKAAAAPS